jgi:hypothetical protein
MLAVVAVRAHATSASTVLSYLHLNPSRGSLLPLNLPAPTPLLWGSCHPCAQI